MQQINIDLIERNILNPRKNFDEAKLRELADSIREVGIIEPLVVSAYQPNNNDSEDYRFRIIAGERRWRAAAIAGLREVPCIVKFDLTPKQEMRLAITENLQRQDLDPIEEAQAYKVLLDDHEYTQEKLGAELGVSQSHIANRIRLLELPESVQQNISREIISPSHGRVLAGHKQLPEAILKKAAEAMAERNVPVARAGDTIGEIIGREGKPLFNNYSSNVPEFKTEDCEGCQSRVMGHSPYYGNGKPYCVKPSCWEKKQQEAKQEWERELVDKAQKSAKKGGGVVDLRKFSYDQYEEFQDYKTKDLDLSECQDCEHKKVAQGYSDSLTEACFMPSCFKKKQTAATRKKNKAAKTAFQSELEEIAELAQIAAGACLAIPMPRPVLIYLAAMVLCHVQNVYERGKTRYQWVKEQFGWDDDFFKGGAHGPLVSEWGTFRARLEDLTDGQLWEVIFEWPAVAEGLTGARSWMFEQGLAAEERDAEPSADLSTESAADPEPEVPAPDPVDHTTCRKEELPSNEPGGATPNCADCYRGACDGTICAAGFHPDTCRAFQQAYKCAGGLVRDHKVTKDECYECAKNCGGCLEMRVAYGFIKKEDAAHLLRFTVDAEKAGSEAS